MHSFGLTIDLNHNHYEATKNNNSNMSKFYDDDTFTKVSLNLLARYEAFDLTASEAIKATLIRTEEQVAFYQALCHRMAQNHVPMLPMVQKIHEEFADELKRASSNQQLTVTTLHAPHLDVATAPIAAPRNIRNPACLNRFLNPRSFMQKQRSNFFPEKDPNSSLSRMKTTKVRNIDWQLANAVQQVVSLSLDGTANNATSTVETEMKDFITSYEPPAMFLKQRT